MARITRVQWHRIERYTGQESEDDEEDDDKGETDILGSMENASAGQEGLAWRSSAFRGLDPIAFMAAAFAKLELNTDSRVLVSLLTDDSKPCEGSVERAKEETTHMKLRRMEENTVTCLNDRILL